jgi:DNA end-binding protein Ku
VSRRAQAAEVDVRERLAATNETRSRATNESETRSRATNGHGRANGHGNGNGHSRRARRVKAEDLDELSKEELYEVAQALDIPGRSQMTKEELKEALLQMQS